MIEVKIDLKETSQPLVFAAKNTYTKGPLYCAYLPDDRVFKMPLANIFRIHEDYGTHASA